MKVRFQCEALIEGEWEGRGHGPQDCSARTVLMAMHTCFPVRKCWAVAVASTPVLGWTPVWVAAPECAPNRSALTPRLPSTLPEVLSACPSLPVLWMCYPRQVCMHRRSRVMQTVAEACDNQANRQATLTEKRHQTRFTGEKPQKKSREHWHQRWDITTDKMAAHFRLLSAGLSDRLQNTQRRHIPQVATKFYNVWCRKFSSSHLSHAELSQCRCEKVSDLILQLFFFFFLNWVGAVHEVFLCFFQRPFNICEFSGFSLSFDVHVLVLHIRTQWSSNIADTGWALHTGCSKLLFFRPRESIRISGASQICKALIFSIGVLRLFTYFQNMGEIEESPNSHDLHATQET